MRIVIVCKPVESGSGCSGWWPVAAVLDPAGIERPYQARNCELVATREQQEMNKAAAEIAKLPEEARRVLNLDFDAVAEDMRRKSEPPAPNAGDQLFVTVSRGPEGRTPPHVTGVYGWECRDDLLETIVPVQVYNDFAHYLEAKAAKSLDALPPLMKAMFGISKRRPA